MGQAGPGEEVLQQPRQCARGGAQPQPHTAAAQGPGQRCHPGLAAVGNGTLILSCLPGLVYLRVYFLDLLVCDGLPYETQR